MFSILKSTSKIKASYIFNTLAICVVIIATIVYINFQKTKQKIYRVGNQANLVYVKSLADNLSSDIIRVADGNLLHEVNNDEILIEYIQADFKLFVTSKYQYIYMIAVDNKNLNRFKLLAGSGRNHQEKEKIIELYNNFDTNYFMKVYNSKKYLYLKTENRGASYLKPIVVNDKVQAIIIVEFSLQEQKTIKAALQTLEDMLKVATIFFTIIFLFMVWFSYIDNRREKEKNLVFKKLKESNKNLEIETAKVHELNETLEYKVSLEVEKNREKDAHMLQQSRLAQMGEMISMIAHQWRQPLSAISSISSALTLKAHLNKLDNQTIIELAQKIDSNSQHLSSTIDDFRNFFKSNKQKLQTNYSILVKSVLAIIEISLSNKNIKLIKDLRADDNFQSYPNEIKQVILNLIKNAEDILIEKEIIDPCIKISTYREKDFLVLRISDNAGGIPEDIITKIFDPYFSTKTTKDGTGLGLYMSKTIIENHCDGRLTAQNDSDGAVFKIILNA